MTLAEITDKYPRAEVQHGYPTDMSGPDGKPYHVPTTVKLEPGMMINVPGGGTATVRSVGISGCTVWNLRLGEFTYSRSVHLEEIAS